MQEEAQHAESVNEEVMPVEGESLEVETPEQPVKEWSDEDEERARFLGWKSPDEWKGDHPPQGLMTDPRQYIERAESILPFRKLQEQYQTLEQSVQKIDRVYAMQVQRERQRAEQQIKALQERQREAVESGDTETWERARKAEDQLRESMQPRQEQPQEVPQEVRAEIDLWRVDNDWFGTDPQRTQAASQAWTEAEQMGIKNPKAILKYIDRKIAETFPDTKPVTRKSTAVEEGLAIGGSVEPFSKLPKEAKDAFKRMVKQGLFEDSKEGRSQYVKDYQDA